MPLPYHRAPFDTTVTYWTGPLGLPIPNVPYLRQDARHVIQTSISQVSGERINCSQYFTLRAPRPNGPGFLYAGGFRTFNLLTADRIAFPWDSPAPNFIVIGVELVSIVGDPADLYYRAHVIPVIIP